MGRQQKPENRAQPFLKDLHRNGRLVDYLASCQRGLQLAHADEGGLAPPVRMMNSMLTKVHALAADDGLPIYDSRVAVAIASLVELYRRERSCKWTRVPECLRFPSLDRAREVTACFEQSLSHGSCAGRGPQTTGPWTGAKVRLGWILEASLTDNNLFSSNELGVQAVPDRMHAFEAGLFMIGYDARCLLQNFPNEKTA